MGDKRRTVHATALEEIRSRVETALCISTGTMSQKDTTALALQARLDEPEGVSELFELQLNSVRARRGIEHASAIAIKFDELATLFGADSLVTQRCAVHDSPVWRAVNPIVTTQAFGAAERAMARALSCTLAERNAKAAWGLPSCRICAYLALHAKDEVYIAMLSLLVGKVVMTDARRLDDLRSRIADEGIDAILLNRCAVALGEAATVAL